MTFCQRLSARRQMKSLKKLMLWSRSKHLHRSEARWCLLSSQISDNV